VILERYLYREVVRSFVALLGILLMIYTSMRFVRFLGDAAAGKISSSVIAEMLALKLIGVIGLVLPLCFYLAVFVGLSRLRRDNEITALAGAGLGPRYLMARVLRLSLVFTVFAGVVTLLLAPVAEQRLLELEATAEELARSLAAKASHPLVATKRHVNAITDQMVGTMRSWSDADALVSALGDPECDEARRTYLRRRGGGG